MKKFRAFSLAVSRSSSVLDLVGYGLGSGVMERERGFKMPLLEKTGPFTEILSYSC